jgi:hypothetical protein
MFIVYAKINSSNDIIVVESGDSESLADTAEWVKIDEGIGDKYHHPGAHYFSKPYIITPGIYRYQWINFAVYEKTDAEIAAEEATLPTSAPTADERLSALESALSLTTSLIVAALEV